MNNPVSPTPASFSPPTDLAAYDGRSIMLNIISFIAPPLGLVLYLLLMIARLPRKATSVGRSATAGVITYIMCAVLAAIVTLIIIGFQRSQEQANVQDTTVAVTRPPAPMTDQP